MEKKSLLLIVPVCVDVVNLIVDLNLFLGYPRLACSLITIQRTHSEEQKKDKEQ